MKTSLLLILVLFSYESFAEELGGIFIEPGLTYQRTKGTVDYFAPLASSEVKLNGFGAMARGGVQVLDFLYLGADVRYARPTFEDVSNHYTVKGDVFNYGIMVGAQLPIVGLRAWAGYVIGGMANPDRGSVADVKFSDATGVRLGVGMHILLVSLNLEYQSIEYGTTNLEKIGAVTVNTNLNGITLKEKGLVASVSFPIGL